MRFLRKVAGRGSLTLPSDVREALNIEEGDIVEFSIVGIVRKGAPKHVQSVTDVPDVAPA